MNHGVGSVVKASNKSVQMEKLMFLMKTICLATISVRTLATAPVAVSLEEKSKMYLRADLWNSNNLSQTYANHSRPQYRLAQEAIEWAKRRNKVPFTGNILDFGCGSGAVTTELLHPQVSGRITAFDPAQSMIATSRSLYPVTSYPDVDFTSDHEDWENQTFDVITSFSVFHILPEPLLSLSALARRLKRDGTMLALYPVGSKQTWMSDALKEAAEKRGYKLPELFIKPDRARLLDPNKAREFFEEAGYACTDLEFLEVTFEFDDAEDLRLWLQPTISPIFGLPDDDELFREFAATYMRNSKQESKKNSITLPMNQIRVVLKKS